MKIDNRALQQEVPEKSFHKLLLRQMKQLGLSTMCPPQDPFVWKNFLDNISKVYIETDNERELLNRSMQLSSNEFIELNAKVKESQRISRLGYWTYIKENHLFNLSDEFCALLGLSRSHKILQSEEFLDLFEKNERTLFSSILEKAMMDKNDIEFEIKIKSASGEYSWFNVILHSYKHEESLNLITGIVMDINQRKIAELNLKKVQQEMLAVARQAGMVDVATSILHNVGNVLNSVSVSIKIIQEYFAAPQKEKLQLSMKMILENSRNLEYYLTKDDKGKLLPEYIVKICQNIIEGNIKAKSELDYLSENFRHIKDIVAAQEDLNLASGFNEKIYLPEIIDSALRISGLIHGKKSQNGIIKIIKNYSISPFIIVDKTKLMQVLVNVLKNARDAVNEVRHKINKEISIQIIEESKNKINVIIQDNGVGILEENLIKIFSSGFTTKHKGHGFGLHASAIAAKVMHGELIAKSDGLEKGATFILILPNNTNME